MASTELPLDRRSDRIREMFGRVAPRYDLLNHLLSASLDRRWRRRLATSLDLPAGSRVLDLCSGTGDQAVALRRRGLRVTAADFCLPMLTRARPKFDRGGAPRPRPVQADALRLPFPDAAFDGATVSFGLRNVADLEQALGELRRILRPGGELGVLEFTIPRSAPLRSLYLFYFQRLLPAIGRGLSADRGAYAYLPESVLGFPQRSALVDRLARAGFASGRWEELAAGILCLYRARSAA